MIKPSSIDCRFMMQFEDKPLHNIQNSTVRLLSKRFSIALAEELEQLGLYPKNIAVQARAISEKVSVAERFCGRIQFDVTAEVPDATQAQFIDATLAAKAKCQIVQGRAAKISLNAQLQNVGSPKESAR